MDNTILSTDFITDMPLFKRGKVREIYQINDGLLIVASDRISAFDVIMPSGIPDKGKILTAVSKFWFDFTKNIVKNHIISTDFDFIIEQEPRLVKYRAELNNRCMLVKKTTPLAIECVVRGYLAGSGWKEYKKSGTVCGIKLPQGLIESEKLPEIIFTPATKAESGHDENITPEKASSILGRETFEFIREKSIDIYKKASEYALKKGIIIADTKFEFGKINTVIASPKGVKQSQSEIILIDEILTPDSSRFWPKDQYQPGKSQPSFDKQFLRDYLETLSWDKTPPGPILPDEIINKTRQKYSQALELLTQNT